MADKKGTRHALRRDLKQAVASLETGQAYITRVGAKLEAQHPGLYSYASLLVASLQANIDSIKSFRAGF